jgi:phosphate transport system permease protein
MSEMGTNDMHPPPIRRSAWQDLAPTAGEIISGSLTRALVLGLVVALLYAGWRILVAATTGPTAELGGLAYDFAVVGALATGLFVPLCLLFSTRRLADRSFTAFGLLATFFGLAMLVVFFVRLGTEVRHWFAYTPQLVEARNAELRELGERAANAKKMLDEEIAKVRLEMEDELSRTPEDEKAELRKIYEEEVIPQKIADLKINVKEFEQIATGSYREDTSPWALLIHFLTSGPSDEPQDAGVYPALVGSIWVAVITILFAVPVGVGAALYLEEYKQNNWLGRIIQVNINNLAGVPSIVYGILGTFVFVELIFKPLEMSYPDTFSARNVVGGGLTLGLLTLPVVIVSAQEAIRAVPDSLRQGAYALGATHWQSIWKIVLPMSTPGILTGTILSISRAIGEAAPLIFFGALLYVNQEPSWFTRFSVMPMQIFDWTGRPPVTVGNESVEIWKYNAALASLLLLGVLLSLNGIAIYFRNRAQKGNRY